MLPEAEVMVEPDAAEVAESTEEAEVREADRGLKAIGSQARMLSRARLRTAHQLRRSSRVSAESRCRRFVTPDFFFWNGRKFKIFKLLS